jgi:cytochrome P450 family 6
MTYEQIAANVFIFYIAGNESSSSTIAYTLYELTQNEDLMERAKMDINKTLEKHDGKITYEAIMEMKFIDLCVKETLRKYPALPILNRECTKDFKVPDMDFVIKKGTSVIISLLGLNRDEKLYPNAEKYDPERFLSIDFNEDMYMPFGIGPRNCIAFRMGLLIVKVAVVMLLKNFNFKASSIKELDFDFGTVTLLPKEGDCMIKILKD